MKIFNFLNKYHKHIICIIITIIFILFALFYFKYSHLRLIESFIDLFNSFKFYVVKIFKVSWNYQITINEFTKQPFEMPFNLPSSWLEFKILVNQYFKLFVSKENFILYLRSIGLFALNLSRFLTLLFPLILVLILLNNKTIVNNNFNLDSKPLKIWKKIEDKIIIPIYYWIINFIGFLKNNSYYLKIWVFIWLYNFQIITILIEFIAYYLYLISSFDLLSLYIQFLKLLMDLSIMIDFIPTLGWMIIGYFIFNKIRLNIGYQILNHMELRNRGFINERPIVLMIVGTMGLKKTTILTDIAISEEIILRNKAFELILECDMKFPNFPWINLENSLKKAIVNHSVFNLATCKRFAISKMLKFKKNPIKKNIFYYDYDKYGLFYNNYLEIVNIWDVIEDYCKLYFIYIIQSSLLISNYSIRVDNLLNDLGNFPLWNTDLFHRESTFQEAYSRHSHILDFDMLRLGKKVLEDNENKDLFEFGVINITEIGKERGNAVELQNIKKKDLSANQKNDLFNKWLKMVRHSATVCNYPFVKVITDDQRPESLGADARELAEIIHINSCSEFNLACPFFAFEELIIQFIFSKFEDYYYNHRFSRGDNIFKLYIFKNIVAFLLRHQKFYHNTFGYYNLNLSVEQGTLSGKLLDRKYFLMFKKIYSNRFSTDCFSEFFINKALRSNKGLNDLFEFNETKATFEEMAKENSYFFNELINGDQDLSEKDNIDISLFDNPQKKENNN